MVVNGIVISSLVNICEFFIVDDGRVGVVGVVMVRDDFFGCLRFDFVKEFYGERVLIVSRDL